MRFKKAFTLAEILIVLTVVGIIATMTVPTLTKGVNEAQYKTAYQKAYNVVSNIAGIEKANSNLPSAADATAILNFFKALDENLDVEKYAMMDGTNNFWSTTLSNSSNAKTSITYNGTTFGEGGTPIAAGNAASNSWSPWIITADNLAYTVTAPSGATCSSKAAINNAASQSGAISATCLLVGVDVNGLHKGPNKAEPQLASGTWYDGLTSGVKLKSLTGDRFIIMIGNNGVAKGNEDVTLSGRLLAGLK